MKGQCPYCEKSYAKRGISRHLISHLTEKAEGNKKGKSFLIEVKPHPKYWRDNPYFLSLWVDGRIVMGDLDDFLQAIWLDCCGHMSEFSDPSKYGPSFDWQNDMTNMISFMEKVLEGRMSQRDMKQGPDLGEIGDDQKAAKILKKGLKLDYVYDMGDSTYLQISVIEEFDCQADERIVLLSRNEIPLFNCEKCNTNPGVAILMGEVEFGILCKACFEQELEKDPELDDEGYLPMVNSPRMGVCGYVGGMIDIERDRYQEVEYVDF